MCKWCDEERASDDVLINEITNAWIQILIPSLLFPCYKFFVDTITFFLLFHGVVENKSFIGQVYLLINKYYVPIIKLNWMCAQVNRWQLVTSLQPSVNPVPTQAPFIV